MSSQQQLNIESLKINANTDELAKVRALVEQFSREIGFSDEKSFKIQLVVDEICTNIMKHSYNISCENSNKEMEHVSQKSIWIELEEEENKMIIRIIDEGTPFNPIEFHSPDIKEHIAHPHRGGLGIPLIKMLSDKISFSTISENPQKNLLEIEFNKG